jgi:transposase
MIEAVPERLEGAPRQFRRRWSDEFKARAVAEALEPGASVSAIAHRIGIHPSQLFGWRGDVRNGQSVSPRRPVLETANGPFGTSAVIELVIGDVVVRAGPDFDEAHLQRDQQPAKVTPSLPPSLRTSLL